jgi:DNA-binding CsgD family transcriptional regulator
MDEYLDGMVPLDPTVRYLVDHPNRSIVHDGLVIGERDKDRHPYYDWHGRHSDTRFRLVGQVCPAPVVQAGVALHRTRQAGRYELRDIEQFAAVHRHLERALSIGFRLGSLGTMQRCTTELLDRNPAAIVLLDERKRVVYANRNADALHSDNDGIKLSVDGLSLLRKQDNDRLQRLIAHVLSMSASSGGAMQASRPSAKRPYVILISPVARRYPALSTLRPAVSIVITDPTRQRQVSSDRLRAAFGLTPAEARLAAHLAAGEELRAAADKLGITYGTARARLADIYQRTETRRQTELITLLLTTLAPGE